MIIAWKIEEKLEGLKLSFSKNEMAEEKCHS